MVVRFEIKLSSPTSSIFMENKQVVTSVVGLDTPTEIIRKLKHISKLIVEDISKRSSSQIHTQTSLLIHIGTHNRGKKRKCKKNYHNLFTSSPLDIGGSLHTVPYLSAIHTTYAENLSLS